MKKLFVLWIRILRFVRQSCDEKVSYDYESVRAGSLILMESHYGRLIPAERRQVYIALRGSGYRGDCSTQNMNRFLRERFLKPFIFGYGGKLQCKIAPATVYENLGLVA